MAQELAPVDSLAVDVLAQAHADDSARNALAGRGGQTVPAGIKQTCSPIAAHERLSYMLKSQQAVHAAKSRGMQQNRRGHSNGHRGLAVIAAHSYAQGSKHFASDTSAHSACTQVRTIGAVIAIDWRKKNRKLTGRRS